MIAVLLGTFIGTVVAIVMIELWREGRKRKRQMASKEAKP